MDLFNLPKDIIFEYALHLDFKHIIELCATNKNFNYHICNNNHFWHQKYIIDFGQPFQSNNWKITYFNTYHKTGPLYGFGFGNYYQSKNITSIDIIALSVACGEEHAVIIDEKNNVLCLGDNSNGQLGLSDTTYATKPTPMGMRAIMVACGNEFTVVIDLDYNVWLCGHQSNNPIPLHQKAKFVACGHSHTVLIDLNDNIWVFGDNEDGQLGLQHRNFVRQPQQIPIKAKYVACGDSHTIIIDDKNNCLATGLNYNGQLGMDVGPKIQNFEIITKNNIPLNGKIVACGGNHTVIIDNNNEVWTFGSNQYGQTGHGIFSDIKEPVKLNIHGKFAACGSSHTIIIDDKNNVLVFGNNTDGQLGIHKSYNPTTPTRLNIKAKYVACGGNQTMLIGFRQ